jgi:hypothetical protein
VTAHELVRRLELIDRLRAVHAELELLDEDDRDVPGTLILGLLEELDELLGSEGDR